MSNSSSHVRDAEWLIAEALQQGAEYVMTQGATQSNHARQTAAACAKFGLKCHILLEDRLGINDTNYYENGNVLLDDLFGATKEFRPSGFDMNQELEDVANKYRAEGKKVYTIVGGGSNEVGALGYVNCAYEILQQIDEHGIDINYIVHATGSAGTQAGLITGLKSVDSDISLLGFGVRVAQDKQEENVFKVAQRTAINIGQPNCVKREDVVADTNYVGLGYGKPADNTIEAIRMFAEKEGILLDPVYSGKAAAGLIDYCRSGKFSKGEKIIFLHTGGSAALHGYINYFK